MQRWSVLAGLGLMLVGFTSRSAGAAEPAARPASAARRVDDGSSPSAIELQQSQPDARQPVITAVAIQPGGKIIATAGDDHLVRVWTTAGARLLRVLRGHRDWVRSLAFSPDGASLASAGDDRRVILWNIETGKQIADMPRSDSAICSIAYCPDGSLIAAVGFDASIRLLSTATGQQINRIATACEDLRCVSFAPDGHRLAAGGRPGIVAVCDLRENQVAREIRTSLKRIRGVVYSPDGNHILTAGEGHLIEIWNASTGEPSGRFSSKPGRIYALTFCEAGQIATGGSDNTVRIWDLQRRIEVRQLRGHTGSVAALAYEPATDVLISGGFDTAVRVWRLDSSDREDTAEKVKLKTSR